MPLITRISEQKRRKNRRNIYLDGVFAFACNQNVVRKFALAEGKSLDAAEIERVLQGEVQQECFDRGIRLLEQRMHSAAELRRKLARHEYGAQVLDRVLERLAQLGYLNDSEFARLKVRDGQRRLRGRRLVMADLLKAGVKGETAREAVTSEYSPTLSREAAEQLVQKNLPRLQRLDGQTARRRLMGLLQRRGFDFELSRDLVQKALAHPED
jgi:regulatory protein